REEVGGFFMAQVLVWRSIVQTFIVRVRSAAATARRAPGRFDSPEQEVFLNLWRTDDRLRALEDELFARFDLTPQQYNVLRLLRAAHPETMPTLALADRLGSRAPGIQRNDGKPGNPELIAPETHPAGRRTGA